MDEDKIWSILKPILLNEGYPDKCEQDWQYIKCLYDMEFEKQYPTKMNNLKTIEEMMNLKDSRLEWDSDDAELFAMPTISVVLTIYNKAISKQDKEGYLGLCAVNGMSETMALHYYNKWIK
jgi:hypothetical protein